LICSPRQRQSSEGQKERKRSFLTLTICTTGQGVKANESEDMARREETASLKPRTHRIQYIRSREGDRRRDREIGPRVDERTRRGHDAWARNEDNPGQRLYCCLHSSGFAVSLPPLPFPLFFGGGTEPSESESSSKSSSSSSSSISS